MTRVILKRKILQQDVLRDRSINPQYVIQPLLTTPRIWDGFLQEGVPSVSNQLLCHPQKTPSTLLLWSSHTLVNVL